MLRIPVVLALVVFAAARAGAEPEPPSKSDLDRLLSGRTVRPPPETLYLDGPVWPPDPDMKDALDSFAMVGLRRDYHLPDRGAVRAEVSKSIDQMTRFDIGVFDWLDDKLTLEQLWRDVVARDPDDLNAAYQLGYLEFVLHGPEASIRALARSSGQTAKVRVKEYGGAVSGGALEGLRCSALFEAGKLEQARKACELATQLDGWSGKRTLVKVLLAQGDTAEALARMREVFNEHGRKAGAQSFVTFAAALSANGNEQEARRILDEGLRRFPTDRMLLAARKKPSQSIQTLEANERREVVDEMVRKLANCGHNYLDLGLSDRAESCLREADRLEPGPALAERLVHQGESDPEAALKRGVAAEKKLPHPLVRAAVAWLRDRAGHPAEARPEIEGVIAEEPYNKKAVTVMWQVCGNLKDWACLLKYRQRAGLETTLSGSELK